MTYNDSQCSNISKQFVIDQATISSTTATNNEPTSPTSPTQTTPPSSQPNPTQLSRKRASLSLELNATRTLAPTLTKRSPQDTLKSFATGIRKKPVLTFGCHILSGIPEAVDVTIPLEKQGWYHGLIARIDAENLLRTAREGSYLVRNCESAKQDYSLSLKSAKGFMHMKIVRPADDKYVLGVFSKPFKSIPEMIHHYSINKLPIRGAEHMSLLYPVIDQLL